MKTRLVALASVVTAVSLGSLSGCTLEEGYEATERFSEAVGDPCSATKPCTSPLVCRPAAFGGALTCQPTAGDGQVCSELKTENAALIAAITALNNTPAEISALRDLMQYLKDEDVVNNQGGFITKLANPFGNTFATLVGKVKAAVKPDGKMVAVVRLLAGPSKKAEIDSAMVEIAKLDASDKATVFSLVPFCTNFAPLLTDAFNELEKVLKGKDSWCTSGKCVCPTASTVPYVGDSSSFCAAASKCVGGSTGSSAPTAPTCTGTDGNCGGTCSTQCANGKICKTGGDCTSGYCNASKKCAIEPAPTAAEPCKDGSKSYKVNAFAPVGACGTKKCLNADGDWGDPTPSDSSCQTGGVPSGILKCYETAGTFKCLSSPPVAAASCTDGVKNGTETDEDCGGSCAANCANSKSCKGDGDCDSGYCNASKKCADEPAPAAGCSDGVKNGTETDVDCGGSCPKCANGKDCGDAADCTSDFCDAGSCAEQLVPAGPTCTDGAMNGDETDEDCGGSCPKCSNGKDCGDAADCASGFCGSGVCSDPPAPTGPTTPGPVAPPTGQCPADEVWSNGLAWNGTLHECWTCGADNTVKVYRRGQWLTWHNTPVDCAACNGWLENGTWKAGRQLTASEAWQKCGPVGERSINSLGGYAGPAPGSGEDLDALEPGACTVTPGATSTSGAWLLGLALGLLVWRRRRR